MANEYGFFAAKNHDRKYSAEDFCALFRDFFTDGVYGRDTNGFAVSSQGDMTVSVSGGTAYVQGRWFRKNSPQVFEVSCGDTVYGRYDGVVIRCDHDKREVYAAVREGIPSETPEKPAPVRDESAYEIVLAYIYIDANAVEVTQADIEDTRGNSELCGWVTSAIDHIDTTGLFAQYEAQWELLRAACAQDEAAVIAAWNVLSAVKKVNNIEPVNGNISMVLDNLPDTANYYKSPYYIQAGTASITASSTSEAMSITFPVAFSSAPFVFMDYSGDTTANRAGPNLKTGSVTKTGFQFFSYTSPAGVNWIAFGKR